MKPPVIFFRDRTFTVEAPAALAPGIAAFFVLAAPPSGRAVPTDRFAIAETGADRFSMSVNGGEPTPALSRGGVIARLASAIAGAAADDALTLRAAAVGWNDKAILIVGADGAGKSALAAWLIDEGFAYRADNCVVLETEAGGIVGLAGPLAFDPDKLSHVATLEAFREAPSVRAGDRMLICPHPTWQAAEPAAECGLIIDVRFEAGAALRLEPLPSTAARLRLLEATSKVVIPGDPADGPVATLAERVPALKLIYGRYAQLDGVLDFLARLIVESESAPMDLEKFLGGLPRQTEPPKTYPIPARTERELHPKLTVGMATYDDFDGVYFTIQAIRMYHPEILDQVEFVVVDNHPDGPCAQPLKQLESHIPNYRYVPMPETKGTAGSRDRVFAEAQGEYVLCVDCHVLLVPGALKRLIDYFDANPRSLDLLQGPMIYDDLKSFSTHMEAQWREGFYGTWGSDPAGADPDGPPFEIVLQGLGLFACRKDAWPGFNPAFRGFGGEEGYIHEKFRGRGGRVLCLPFLRWLHRFPRPMGVPYPNVWKDRIRNYLIGFADVGFPAEAVEQHFRGFLYPQEAEDIFAAIEREFRDAPPR